MNFYFDIVWLPILQFQQAVFQEENKTKQGSFSFIFQLQLFPSDYHSLFEITEAELI